MKRAATRIEPSRTLLQGQPYIRALEQDVRITWARFQDEGPDWRQCEVSEQERFEEEQEQQQ